MFSFSPWKFETDFARIDEGTHKNVPCALMDLTLKSAADFMEDHKHFLNGAGEHSPKSWLSCSWAKSRGKKSPGV